MFILGNLILAIAQVLNILFNVYMMILFVRVIISWVSPDPYNPIVQFLIRTTEPVLEPIRRRLPAMPIDLSPLIVFIAIQFLQQFLITTLLRIGYSLQ